MDEMVIKEIIKTRLVWLGLFLCSAAIMIFCAIGVYDVFWNVPAKREKIAEITTERDAWRSRVKELDRYVTIVTKEKKAMEAKYRVAIRWSRFHEMMCDKDQEVRFDMLENYLKKEKGLYKSSEEINRFNK